MTHTRTMGYPSRHSSQLCLHEQDSDKTDLMSNAERRCSDPLRLYGRVPWSCRDNECSSESENQLCKHSILPPSQYMAEKPQNAHENIKHGTDNQDVTRDDTETVMNIYDHDENFSTRNQQNPDITQESTLQSSQSTTSSMHYQLKHHHQHHDHKTRYQPQPSCNLTSSITRQKLQQHRISITANLVRNIISVFILNAILNHLSHMNHLQASYDKQLQLGLFHFVSSVQAGKWEKSEFVKHFWESLNFRNWLQLNPQNHDAWKGTSSSLSLSMLAISSLGQASNLQASLEVLSCVCSLQCPCLNPYVNLIYFTSAPFVDLFEPQNWILKIN